MDGSVLFLVLEGAVEYFLAASAFAQSRLVANQAHEPFVLLSLVYDIFLDHLLQSRNFGEIHLAGV